LSNIIKKFKKNIAKILIGSIILLCSIYLVISIFILLPYFKNFIEGKYILDVNDLPNFSDVFNSIFSVISILVTSYLSYLIYELTKKENDDLHNYNISSSASIFLRSFETCVINGLIDKYNDCREGSSKLNTIVTVDQKDVFDHMSKIIGYIEDEDLKDGLYNLYFIMIAGKAILSIIDKNIIVKSDNPTDSINLYETLQNIKNPKNVESEKYFYVSSDKHKKAIDKLYELSKFKQ